MLSFANKAAAEGAGASLRAKVSGGGMKPGLRVAGCFESAACRAALSFTLVRAESITAHHRSKGTRRKKRRRETVINPLQFQCVTT